MLKKLGLHNVGPADDMVLDPIGQRFNLITGDNGLGKSFLLEAAWWVLTRTWHDIPAVPHKKDATIEFIFDGDKNLRSHIANWNPAAQEWTRKRGRPPNPGLVIYGRIDGSFSGCVVETRPGQRRGSNRKRRMASAW